MTYSLIYMFQNVDIITFKTKCASWSDDQQYKFIPVPWISRSQKKPALCSNSTETDCTRHRSVIIDMDMDQYNSHFNIA